MNEIKYLKVAYKPPFTQNGLSIIRNNYHPEFTNEESSQYCLENIVESDNYKDLFKSVDQGLIKLLITDNCDYIEIKN